jgi:hypothetical protein
VPAAKLPRALRLLDRLGEEHYRIGRVRALPRGVQTRVIYK